MRIFKTKINISYTMILSKIQLWENEISEAGRVNMRGDLRDTRVSKDCFISPYMYKSYVYDSSRRQRLQTKSSEKTQHGKINNNWYQEIDYCIFMIDIHSLINFKIYSCHLRIQRELRRLQANQRHFINFPNLCITL